MEITVDTAAQNMKLNSFMENDMQCMILCGGKGTRLRDVTEILPKPMVNIGEYPIVFHIMKWYAKFGVKNFILCLGYKKECFINYFVNFVNNTSDITVDLADNSINVHNENKLDWRITLADTGLESKTGKRLAISSKYLNVNENFFFTYGDGVSDVNVENLYQNHVKSGKSLTMTAVKVPSRFGLVDFDADGGVCAMNEKNVADGYINGGFMVINKSFIQKYISIYDDVFLEAEPMTDAVSAGDVNAYAHNGFWQCMDSRKEYEILNNIWKSGKAKWV